MICFLGICNFARRLSPRQDTHHFNASNKSATVRLTNQSKIDPYLAQSWIEDASGKKRVIIFQHCRRWNVLSLMNRYKFA